MCGVAAIARAEGPVCLERLRGLVRAQRHRGPDGQGVWRAADASVGLGHARLAVIDVAGGAQPMTDPATGCTLVFNGEIYDHRALRARLSGVRFRTDSDTEVLLQAWIRWGPACLDRLDGMFAFALYDPRDRTLHLARDPLGIKPLYFALDAGELVVASELRAVATWRRPEPDLDPAALSHYCTIGYALAPKTLLAGVHQLPHGHHATWRDGRLTQRRYADLAGAVNARAGASSSARDATERTRELCRDAVRRQLVADVPVGAFLSSGVDSSLLCALAAGAGAGVRACTMDFAERGFSEAAGARRTARALGLSHSVFPAPAERLVETWRADAWATDAPIFDDSFLPTRALCEAARAQVTVALSGDGGDELFLGYATAHADRLARTLRWLARGPGRGVAWLAERAPVAFGKVTRTYKARAFARAFGRPAADAHCGWREIATANELRTLLRPAVADAAVDDHPARVFAAAFDRVPDGDLLTRLSYVDCETWLANDILVKSDRASMAHGLEVRVPLLDLKLARFAMGLPDSLKYHPRRSKPLLRDALADVLPSYPERAPKLGFGAPMSAWLNGPLRGSAEALAAGALGRWLRPEGIRRLVGRHQRRRDDHGRLLWALLVLDAWFGALGAARTDTRTRQ